MARDILAVTATSASSERSFSVARDLLGLSRYRLTPEVMEASSCLCSWLRSGFARISPSQGSRQDVFQSKSRSRQQEYESDKC